MASAENCVDYSIQSLTKEGKKTMKTKGYKDHIISKLIILVIFFALCALLSYMNVRGLNNNAFFIAFLSIIASGFLFIKMKPFSSTKPLLLKKITKNNTSTEAYQENIVKFPNYDRSKKIVLYAILTITAIAGNSIGALFSYELNRKSTSNFFEAVSSDINTLINYTSREEAIIKAEENWPDNIEKRPIVMSSKEQYIEYKLRVRESHLKDIIYHLFTYHLYFIVPFILSLTNLLRPNSFILDLNKREIYKYTFSEKYVLKLDELTHDTEPSKSIIPFKYYGFGPIIVTMDSARHPTFRDFHIGEFLPYRYNLNIKHLNKITSVVNLTSVVKD